MLRFPAGLQFFNPELHRTALRRKFHRIAKDIDQNLVNPQDIPIKTVMPDISFVYHKPQPCAPGLGSNNGRQLFHQPGKGYAHPVQGNLGAFYFAHVQNIIDKAQQMSGRHGYFLQAAFFFKANVELRGGLRTVHGRNFIKCRPVHIHTGSVNNIVKFSIILIEAGNGIFKIPRRCI